MLYLILEQSLNGLQYGLMLFLLAAGLTLVFGIMDVINLAHGSLYMIGAFLAAAFWQALQSFFPALVLAMLATALIGLVLERLLYRRLQRMNHLSQVLATFALVLIANETVKIVFGAQPLMIGMPERLSGAVEILPDLHYPAFRLLIIAVGLAVAVGLYLLVNHTRAGMWMRAGASNPAMAAVRGVRIQPLFAFVFALAAALCALAGALLGPLLAVSVGMGESILIPAFEVIVIGGIGSMRGALVGALLVGMIDTVGRLLITAGLRLIADPAVASSVGPTLASILVSLLMVSVLYYRPQGLFPARG